MKTLIPKNKHAIIRMCKIVLNTDEDITTYHVEKLKLKIRGYLADGLSPTDIKKLHNIKYTDFGMFIKKCLGIKIKSVKDAVNNFYLKAGRSITDEKEVYYKACQFKFDPYSIPEIPGYTLLLKVGIYHPINNPNGVCRDHMLSIEFGWRNKIDSSIISSPYNCQFITNIDNVKKGTASCINIDNLIERISSNTYALIENSSKRLTLSRLHRQRISETNSKYMTITNGYRNLRVLKSSDIPKNYRRGMTRKNKMVVQLGVEPRNEIF